MPSGTRKRIEQPTPHPRNNMESSPRRLSGFGPEMQRGLVRMEADVPNLRITPTAYGCLLSHPALTRDLTIYDSIEDGYQAQYLRGILSVLDALTPEVAR